MTKYDYLINFKLNTNCLNPANVIVQKVLVKLLFSCFDHDIYVKKFYKLLFWARSLSYKRIVKRIVKCNETKLSGAGLRTQRQTCWINFLNQYCSCYRFVDLVNMPVAWHNDADFILVCGHAPLASQFSRHVSQHRQLPQCWLQSQYIHKWREGENLIEWKRDVKWFR